MFQNFIGFRAKAMNVGFIILLIQLFLWISASYIYGEYAETVRNILIIYFFMFLITRVTLGGRPAGMSPRESWSGFLLAFVFTSAILLALGFASGLFEVASLTEVTPAAVGVTALGFGALHAFVKAYIEEDVFRSALPQAAGLGDFVSNILFGLFHFSMLMTVGGLTLETIWLPIIVLISLGMIWSVVRNHFGIMGSTGSHFAWNLFAFGALTSIFVGGVA